MRHADCNRFFNPPRHNYPVMNPVSSDPVLPHEGRHVVHLFFRVDYAAWEYLDSSEKIAANSE